jgi:hypothetical protein
MWLIVTIWALIAAAFLLPPSVTFSLFIGLAVLRMLYLTRDSAIDAAAEVLSMPAQLIADARRNGLHVLKVIFGWATAIAALGAIIVVFRIPF